MVKYDESSIEHFSGLEGVRKRPAMYVGAVNEHGVFTILREVMDNAVDEFLAERNTMLGVSWGEDGFWVMDAGPGIPSGPHPKKKISTLQLILTELHAGGKFKADAYKQGSRGTHGVGISTTVALSSVFEVWTRWKGQWFYARYEKGKCITEVQVQRKPTGVSLKLVGQLGFSPRSLSTVIHFQPDAGIFSKVEFKERLLVDWLQVTSYLNPGFICTYVNQSGKTNRYESEEGAIALLELFAKRDKVKLYEGWVEVEDEAFDLVIGFSDHPGVRSWGYTNGLYNKEGGTHVSTALNAFTRTLSKFARNNDEFGVTEALDGLYLLINVHLTIPNFNTQAKDRLVDPRIAESRETMIEGITKDLRKDKGLIQQLLEKARKLYDLNHAFKQQRSLVRALNISKTHKGILLPGKLISTSGIPSDKRELFLLEGDSASGTARKSRYQYQDVLPLRGKFLNVCRSPKGIVNNEVILNILRAIGYNPANGRDAVNQLRVSKIISLTDADVDGSHIASLIQTLLWSVVPGVYKKGFVYSVKAPEFICEQKGHLYRGETLEGLRQSMGIQTLPKTVQHLKGWGEVNAGVLRSIAFDPKQRSLIKLTEPAAEEVARFQQLMGTSTDYRKELMGITL